MGVASQRQAQAPPRAEARAPKKPATLTVPIGRLCRRCGELVDAGAECECLRVGGKLATPRRVAGERVWRSRRWRVLRLRVFERDGWVCGRCGARVGVGRLPRGVRRAVGQHVVPFVDERDELAWDERNVVTRCAECAGAEDAPRASADRRRAS